MPKRAKTPPPADDEPKYLTVVHPYPLRATMELIKDKTDFVRWLACCTGKDPLYSFFFKPSAPDMVIIEVDRDFDNFNGLLGAHRWSEFLKKPSDEERTQVTKIFYCKHGSGREVQKNGWKQVNIEEHWFNGWSPNNQFIAYPYPETTYCEVPPENVTNGPLCRPLPVKSFPPPPKAPAPPVGSKEWLEAKAKGNAATTTPQSSNLNAAAGVPKAQTTLGINTNVGNNGGKRGKKGKKGSPATTVGTPVIASPVARTLSAGAWATVPPGIKSRTSSSVGVAPPSSAGTSPGSSARGSQSPATPPINTPVTPNAGNKPPSSVVGPPPGLGFSPPLGLGSKPAASSLAAKNFLWSDDFDDDQSESVEFDLGSQARGGYGTGPAGRAGSDVDTQVIAQSLSGVDLEDSGDEEDDAFPSAHSIVSPNGIQGIPKSNNVWGRRDGGVEDRYNSEEEEGGKSVWHDYSAPKEDKPLPWKQMCIKHGVLCKKGICKEYAMQEMEERKKKEAEERKQKIDKARKKREREARKEEAGGGDDAGPWAGAESDDKSDAGKAEQDGDDDSPAANLEASPWDDASDFQAQWSTNPVNHHDDDARSVVSRSSQAAWAYSATPWDNDGASGVSAGPSSKRSKDKAAKAAVPRSARGNDAVSEVGSVKSSGSKAWPSEFTPWDEPTPASRKSGANTPASGRASTVSHSGWTNVSKGPW